MTETTIYSHPDQAIRHNYPLANREVGVSAAIRLLNRTMPYAIVRFGILFGVSVATIIWAALTVGGAGSVMPASRRHQRSQGRYRSQP